MNHPTKKVDQETLFRDIRAAAKEMADAAVEATTKAMGFEGPAAKRLAQSEPDDLGLGLIGAITVHEVMRQLAPILNDRIEMEMFDAVAVREQEGDDY